MGERRVGVALDFSACSKQALRWATDNLLRHGDHLIAINVQSSVDYEHGISQLWESTGSPLIPLHEFSDPSVPKIYGLKSDPEILEILDCAAEQKRAQVVVKIYWGDPREKLCDAVENIPLDCLVMGSRGMSKIKRVLLGSVSNYIVNNAPCPVTVVKGSEPEN